MECPICKSNMVEIHDNCMKDDYLKIAVHCDIQWNECVRCGYKDIYFNSSGNKLYLDARQKMIEEWLAYKVFSFKDIERRFVSHTDALALMKKIKPLNELVKRQLLEKSIDEWTFHFTLFNRKYYLKKSVMKYARYANGLWSLDCGLDGYCE